MQRTDLLFGACAAVLLLVGLAADRFVANGITTWSSTGTTYAVPTKTAFFAIAALFSLFAFLYSIGYIPFSQTMPPWHLWLSIAGVALTVAGFWGLGRFAPRQPPLPANSAPVLLVAFGMLGGPLIFAAAQLWFVSGFVRALVRMRHA